MAKYIIKDAVLFVDGHDLSDRVASVSVIMEGDDVDVSTMGTGVHEHLTGLRNDRIEVTFLSDFAANKVDAVLYELLATADSQPEFPVYVKPFDAAVSSTNPKYATPRAILNSYQPIAGNVGDRSEVTVTFFSNEAITRTYT
jgi:hypothetical protein